LEALSILGEFATVSSASGNAFSHQKIGAWKFDAEDDIRRIAGDNPGTKISVMLMGDEHP
jgi:hypothetical protein